MKLTDIATQKASINIASLTDRELVIDIQAALAGFGFYKDKVDGIVGDRTLAALAEFKKARYLEYPAEIGTSTAKSLLEENHPIPDDKPLNQDKTGARIHLPTGEIVYSNQNIYPHITWGEMTRDGERVPETKQIVQNLIRAARGFTAIRSKYNQPLTITSAYRPPAVNRAVGGVSRSQHLSGLALDIYPSDGDFDRLIKVIKNSDATGLGLGQSQGFLHVDWREGDRVVFAYG